jgi:hypothetical protein
MGHQSTTHHRRGMSTLWSGARRWFAHSWELWLLAFGHGFAGLFINVLAISLDQIVDPAVRGLVVAPLGLYAALVTGPLSLRHVASVVFLLLLVQVLRGRSVRRGCDLLGALLTLRCGLQIGLLNLLLLAQLRSGSMLLIQLVLFLPLVTINFGWIYWRLDSGSRRLGRRQISFEEEPPQVFDYFHAAANALLQFEPSGAKPLNRRLKALFVLHGVVMMNLVALTLSRAIGLASGSG